MKCSLCHLWVVPCGSDIFYLTMGLAGSSVGIDWIARIVSISWSASNEGFSSIVLAVAQLSDCLKYSSNIILESSARVLTIIVSQAAQRRGKCPTSLFVLFRKVGLGLVQRRIGQLSPCVGLPRLLPRSHKSVTRAVEICKVNWHCWLFEQVVGCLFSFLSRVLFDELCFKNRQLVE